MEGVKITGDGIEIVADEGKEAIIGAEEVKEDKRRFV